MEDGNLKVVFSEILRGYSLVDSSFGPSRINHFNNFDSASLDIKNKEFYDKAIKEGLPTRDERIDFLLKEGIWTEEKNKEIINTKSYVVGLKNSKSKAFIQSQIDEINAEVEKGQLKLSKLELEKEELIGFTAQGYASRRINEFYMYNAFADLDGKRKFEREEFEELSEPKMMELISIYNQTTKKFNSHKLKLISLAGFFTNLFYLCDNDAFVFYGKPIVELSFYQIELFGYARYYKAMMEQTEGKPPEEMTDNPEKLVEWFDSTKSAKEALDKVDKGEGTASSLVGATKQDLKRLGLDNPQETINLAKKAAEKGGRLTMEDMMKLHGV
tara:strand:+ start:90 stop:1076 length:987 start_codon:yes stop_codon:yes gene_type:complete